MIVDGVVVLSFGSRNKCLTFFFFLPFFFFADEPKYWWFELMQLLNKTMMCGGLVILSPGSPSQVVCAILIMMFHMLMVLKLAPYVKDSEDWSSFAASLGLTLVYVGALVQMLQAQRREEFDSDDLSYAGIAMNVLPVLCVSTVVAIMIFVDCGVASYVQKKLGKTKKGGKASASLTQVQPINTTEVAANKPVKSVVEVKQDDFDDAELLRIRNFSFGESTNKIAVSSLNTSTTSRKQLK